MIEARIESRASVGDGGPLLRSEAHVAPPGTETAGTETETGGAEIGGTVGQMSRMALPREGSSAAGDKSGTGARLPVSRMALPREASSAAGDKSGTVARLPAARMALLHEGSNAAGDTSGTGARLPAAEGAGVRAGVAPGVKPEREPPSRDVGDTERSLKGRVKGLRGAVAMEPPMEGDAVELEPPRELQGGAVDVEPPREGGAVAMEPPMDGDAAQVELPREGGAVEVAACDEAVTGGMRDIARAAASRGNSLPVLPHPLIQSSSDCIIDMRRRACTHANLSQELL